MEDQYGFIVKGDNEPKRVDFGGGRLGDGYAILKLEDDTLTVAVKFLRDAGDRAADENVRPKDFTSREGDKTVVVVSKQVK